ncbi:MAG: hypothetical protein ACFFDK_08120 [Promethearchaeota archaeon]
MIKDILCIYILDEKGTPIFIRENYVQGSGDANHALLSDFVSALQSLAQEFGEDETRVIELSDSKILSTRDKITNYSFIIKSEIKSKNKKIFGILNQIKNIFIEKFTGHLASSVEVKKKIMLSFEEAINEIIAEPTDSLKGFLKSI